MERSPLLTWLFHVRAVLLLMFLGMVDAVLVHIAYNTVMQSGASVQLVFGFEVREKAMHNLSFSQLTSLACTFCFPISDHVMLLLD